jgi:hypothetical protein
MQDLRVVLIAKAVEDVFVTPYKSTFEDSWQVASDRKWWS